MVTSPRQSERVFEYEFRRFGDVWVLDSERAWYSGHVLSYVEEHLDMRVVRKHLTPAQTTLSEYDSDRPSDAGGEIEVASTAASVD